MKSKPSIAKYLQQKRAAYQQGGVAKGLQAFGTNLKNGFSWENPKSGGNAMYASSLGSSAIGMLDPGDENGVQSDLGAFGQGALSGASAGAAAGPLGMLGGAVIGGGLSLANNQEAQKAAQEAKRKKRDLDTAKQMQDSAAIMASYDNAGTGIKSLERGGAVYSWPGGYAINPFKFTPNKNTFSSDAGLNFAQGGQLPAGNGDLQPIGNSDSYEVKGDNPQATDDVLLQGGHAAVDHGEVVKPVDEGLRIFSDVLKPPGSKLSFSKLAKQLEKQKTKDETRFPDHNPKVEEKLNALFQQQQLMNGNNNGESTAEAHVPSGEQAGQGFHSNDGSMFNAGGNMNLNRGIISKNNRYHDNITPEQIGMNKGNYLGNLLMKRNPQQIVSEQVYNQPPARFTAGGRLMEVKANPMEAHSAVSWNPKVKGYRTYHAMTPDAIGMNRPVGFASHVMEGAERTQSGEEIYRKNNPHKIAGRYELGGVIFKKTKKAKNPSGGTTFDYTSMSPEKNYQTGGILPAGYNVKTDTLGLYKNPYKDFTPAALSAENKGLTQYGLEHPGDSYIAKRTPMLNQALNYNNYQQNLASQNQPGFFDGWIDNMKKMWNTGEHAPPAPSMGKNQGKFQVGGRWKGFEDESGPAVGYGINQQKQPLGSTYYGGNASSDQPATGEAQDDAPGAPGRKIDWNNLLATGSTLLPTFANMQLAKKLPPVADVYLNHSIDLGKVNAADQINAAHQGLRAATIASKQNSVNPNAQRAGIGHAQSQFVNQTNNIYGEVNRQNTNIRNQEKLYNSQIQGINNQHLAQQSQAEQARKSNILGLKSKLNADLANKTLGLIQQSNLKDLDRQKYNMFMEWLNKTGNGLGDRNQFLGAIEKKKKGGLIRRKAMAC